MNSPASHIDHTLLRADATNAEIAALCEEAVEYGFASVCVQPCHIALAARLLYGSEVAAGTVIGFPLGTETSEVKAFQTRHAVSLGATELDMVINLGAAREGCFDRVCDDIQAVVMAAEGMTLKVIIECCLFDESVKRQLAETVAASGADYVKTSTGFAQGGATLKDVALLHQVAAGRVAIKAAGGIRDWESCQRMLSAGARRIGASSGVEIVRQWRTTSGGL
ncbi:MAG: deoxyribose-phosphate aldolase [Desulfuromonadales bacterium]|nr:deoxyribose-phosphate aldolase [Desulfuromonadales bacterium]